MILRLACRILTFALLTTVPGCAKMVAPSGGPEDTSPPGIVSITPPPSAGLPGLEEIVIIWSERLLESSVEVSLHPAVPCRTSVSGRRTSISLFEPLGGRTIVVHLPPSISDLRGNTSGQPIDLAYSGLDSLPGGTLAVSLRRQGGTVLGESVRIELFNAVGGLERSTSPDTTGSSLTGWLEDGEYKLICYEDLDYSRTWEPEAEAGADTLIALSSSLIDTLFVEMTLTVVDTLGPRLVSVTPTDLHHLTVDFGEEPALPLDPASLFSISDSSGSITPVLGAWASGARDARSMVLVTGLMPEGRLILRTGGVEDYLGNPAAPDSIWFESTDSSSTDTLRVRSTFPAPGAVEVTASTMVEFSLSDWVDPDSMAAHFSMVRVADGSSVEGVFERKDSRTFAFRPLHELMGEEQYRIEILPGMIGPAGDSLEALSWSFVAAWGNEPGSIVGTVTGGGSLIIEVRAAGSGGETYSFDVGGGGPFELESIAAGRYTLSAWSDRNGNSTWDPGEPYGTWPGVVLVRPGLSTTGVDIEILP